MSSTFDQVATIIAETCDIPRDTITPESHAIDDLGIDSLDFLDIAFAIDKAFGIKLPLEKWTQEVNDGKATTEQYFVLKNLSARIDELVAAKEAKMRTFVSPGDLLTVEASIVHEGSGYAITAAKVRVSGELRCNATITFGIVPFPNPELRVHMDAMAKRIGFPQQAISHD